MPIGHVSGENHAFIRDYTPGGILLCGVGEIISFLLRVYPGPVAHILDRMRIIRFIYSTDTYRFCGSGVNYKR